MRSRSRRWRWRCHHCLRGGGWTGLTSPLGAGLLAFGSSDGAVMVEISGVELSQRLSLELCLCQRLGRRKGSVDHSLHAASAPARIVAATAHRLELGESSLRLGFRDHAVMIGVDHLEHHVRALLRLGSRLVALPAAAALLRKKGRRHHRRAERYCDEKLVHALDFLR